MIGEIGGTDEDDAAAFVEAEREEAGRRASSPAAPPRRASAWATPARSSAAARTPPSAKIAALKAAGIAVAESPATIGESDGEGDWGGGVNLRSQIDLKFSRSQFATPIRQAGLTTSCSTIARNGRSIAVITHAATSSGWSIFSRFLWRGNRTLIQQRRVDFPGVDAAGADAVAALFDVDRRGQSGEAELGGDVGGPEKALAVSPASEMMLMIVPRAFFRIVGRNA